MIALDAGFINGLPTPWISSAKKQLYDCRYQENAGLRIGPWSYPHEGRDNTDQVADPKGRTVDVKQFADAALGGIDFLVDTVGGEVAVIRPSKKAAPPA
jgi:hypothetical protein